MQSYIGKRVKLNWSTFAYPTGIVIDEEKPLYINNVQFTSHRIKVKYDIDEYGISGFISVGNGNMEFSEA